MRSTSRCTAGTNGLGARARAHSRDSRLARRLDEVVARPEHVVERRERVGVVALEALALDAPEHVAEIEVAGARLQVHLVAVAEAVGEPHLGHLRHVERVHETRDALGHEVRVVGGERELEGGRLDALAVVAPLLDGVREVVHLGILGLLVEVLEQDQRALLLGVGRDALQALEPRLHAHRLVGAEVVAGVHHDPLRTELADRCRCRPSGTARPRRPRTGEYSATFTAESVCSPSWMPCFSSDARTPAARRSSKVGEGVGRGVELDVDVAHAVLRRPGDPVFELRPAPDVHPDPLFKAHIVPNC